MLNKLYTWYGKRTVWIVSAIIIALSVLAIGILQKNTTEESEAEVLQQVTVKSVAELGSSENVTLLGTVNAVSEAEIQSETSGRVTSVPVSLGESISAGQVIATLENAQERAAVLQAEGVYEAALASASAGDISVAQAETNLSSAQQAALSAAQSAYTTVNNAFFTEIDDIYRNPTSPLTSPLLHDGTNRSFLSAERVAFQDILPSWQNQTTQTTEVTSVQGLVADSIAYTKRTRALVDSFLILLQDRNSSVLNGLETEVWISNFNALRTSLEGAIVNLENSQSGLTSAIDSLEQAKISGTNSSLSAANAQVKQALGSLRAAEANLSKTILRSPIAGTVNELDIQTGDFVGSFAKLAKVANNNALEISVFASQDDLSELSVGDEVLIEGDIPGTITHIGAGIDSDIQKTEVKIGTESEDLVNGSTVRVTLAGSKDAIATGPLLLPITAIKFTVEAGSVFTVENGVLVNYDVAVGAIRGGFVEVTDGVTEDMKIVVDARGLTPGAKVETRE